jgi:hypothetical protein
VPVLELSLDELDGLPATLLDTQEAEASGVELTVRREAERGFAGWASVAFAKTEENEPGEGWLPRLWDQRRALSFGLSWTGTRWNLNLAGLYHSGTPTTSLSQALVPTPAGPRDVIVAGQRNGARLGDYARLDLRASRSVQMRSVRFNYYLEVTNLLNRENPCCKESYYLDTDPNGRVRLKIEEASWLPMLPSFGFQFEF